MPRAYISLGSNLGDRLALLRAAEAHLSRTPGIQVRARSSIYETEPVGFPDQPWFLNRVLQIETTLDPHALLDAVQQVEAALGRTREAHWGPRTIDIDLLLYNGDIVVSERLRIPHPELPRRRFVLRPLAEIDPQMRLPDGRAVADLLRALGDTQRVRRIDAP
ncbi:MAG: 2-amino-4-hydroxy-6-hydroxymethyldihydropteridine diphosphokinase [Armatimonadota bacterium]|nr:2-amino-4-hydroxy-6-hydroxymethyldihydropteridine diphosphokinase [Armatimonadota bacterium]MDR7485285.1 2-amino-4-hydroxy-6-hydroxymethyldihydropteridine diphosphokinase [Armatimonadota bacterium]MDR7533877.1 2-amino-4-hydroxy-6-hydroxymethyldihydropteridine diphosphokinase [Armatimonadota bacterium]MDR7537161.1 2-amino-4-hydroxy-6-hydroxymethyldihydropteridine diphosphokinase [Armatimonadota bacterium]